MPDAGDAVSTELPLVSLIIVNYNGLKHTGRCLESVYALDYPAEKLEVLVIDNGSTDGSVERLQPQFPQATWLPNDANNYCSANNLGMAKAQGTVIGFLNNDVRLNPRWLGELVPVLFTDAHIGGVCGKLLREDGRVSSAGHVELPQGLWADRGAHEPDIGQLETLELVEGLSGAAALYRRRCLEDVGGLDEDFHMYYEDVDLAIRCRARGWKLLYVPSAIGEHAFHGTATEVFVARQVARNRLLLLAKHWPEKLAGALSMPEPSGQVGELRALDVLRDLPSVVAKLTKHHGQDTLVRWLPGMCDELGKLIQLERLFLSQRLDHERQSCARVAAELDEHHRIVGTLQGAVRQAECERDQAECERDQAKCERDQAVAQLEQRIHQLEHAFNALEQSTAHRYLVRPLWTLLFWLRSPLSALRDWEGRRVLILKPFHVSATAAVRALEELKRRWPRARLTLVANVFPQERATLSQLAGLESAWFFGSGDRPLTWWRLPGLIMRAHLKGFAQGVLLVDQPIPYAYGKGRWLLRAVTPTRLLYHVDTGLLESHDLSGTLRASGSLRSVLRYSVGWVALGALAVGFVTVIWLPLWWRRRVHRMR